MMGLLRQRTVQGDDVALGKQGLQWHVNVAQIRIRVHVVGQNAHPEAPADVDKTPADPAGAHHAHGLAVELEARQIPQGEVEVPGTDVGLVDAADGGQQHGHGVLGHGVGGIGRHVEHMYFAEAMLHVHVVEARAAQGDHAHAQLIEPVDDGGVHLVVDEDAHRVRALGQAHGVCREPGVEVFECKFPALIYPLKGGLIVGLGVEKRNFHAGSFRPPHSSAMLRYRNVTICALVQVSLGLNLFVLVPLVIPFSTAQRMASV